MQQCTNSALSLNHSLDGVTCLPQQRGCSARSFGTRRPCARRRQPPWHQPPTSTPLRRGPVSINLHEPVVIRMFINFHCSSHSRATCMTFFRCLQLEWMSVDATLRSRRTLFLIGLRGALARFNTLVQERVLARCTRRAFIALSYNLSPNLTPMRVQEDFTTTQTTLCAGSRAGRTCEQVGRLSRRDSPRRRWTRQSAHNARQTVTDSGRYHRRFV